MFLIAKSAHESSEIALSGLGGDELFGGYDNYLFVKPTQAYIATSPLVHMALHKFSREVFTLQSRTGLLRSG